MHVTVKDLKFALKNKNFIKYFAFSTTIELPCLNLEKSRVETFPSRGKTLVPIELEKKPREQLNRLY
jgi:hypothetical protein